MLSPHARPTADMCHDAVDPHVRQAAHAALLRQPAAAYASSKPANTAQWLERMTTVLAHNIAAGRFLYASQLKAEAPLTLQGYAHQVSAQLVTEWDRVEALRAGDAHEWDALIRRLERAAYRWFGPNGRGAWASWEAREAVAKTCADLWNWLQRQTFPFDVPFDRWADKALRNRMLEATRARRRQESFVVRSLDCALEGGAHTLAEVLATHDLEDWLEQEANREWLARALACLDARQAQALRLWYLEGWPAEEIAGALGVQLSYFYVIKYRALQRLRSLYAPHDPGGDYTEVAHPQPWV